MNLGFVAASLLPGSVFCILMAMEWYETGRKPTMLVRGKQIPVPLIYATVLIGGPLVLIGLLVQSIKRR